MELSKFLDVYLDSGNTLLEGKFTQDPQQAVKMLANFAPNKLPTAVITPVAPTISAKPGATTNGEPTKATATDAIKAAVAAAGMTAYAYKTGGNDMVAYKGATFNPQGGQDATIFTKAEWDATINYYNQQKEVMSAEVEGDSDTGKTKKEAGLDAASQQKADEQARLDASNKIYKEIEGSLSGTGYSVGEGYNAIKRLARNMLGFGGVGKMQSIVNPDTPLDQKTEDASKVKEVALKITAIAHNLENDRPLTESQKKFVQDCVRLRGSSAKTESVYILGGDDCGGELASAGSRVTLRGHIYGVKIGGAKSPLFQIMRDLHKKAKAGDKKYQTEDGKSLVFWGGGDTARSNAYRSLMGVLNEYGPGMAQAWIKCGRRNIAACPEVVDQIKKMVEENKDRVDFKLLLFGAQQFGAGKIREEDMEYAGLEVEGTVKLLEQMFDELGEAPDESTALAWTVGKLLNQWDSIVDHPAFKDCNWQVVGRGPTGVQPDGTKVNEDARLQACPGMTPDSILKQVSTNPKFDVSKGREHFSEEEDVVGISIKLSDGGRDIDLGKSSTAVLDGVGEENAEKRENSRRRNAEWAAEVAKKNEVSIDAEEILEEADRYSDRERDAVNTVMGAVLTDAEGSKAVFREKLNSVGYKEGKGWDKLIGLAKKASKGDENAAAELRLKLTNAYRNKHKNDKGMRYAMGLEAATCGMSTQRQAFVIGDGQTGDNYLGSEGDVAGQAVAGIFGFGWDAPLEMSVTQTGITFQDSQGRTIANLNRRFKDERSNGFFTTSLSWAKEQLTNIGRRDLKEDNSAMKAEDFVRQLQELIQGIDKVATVQN